MTRNLLLFCLIGAASSIAVADDNSRWACMLNNSERIIEIEYEHAGQAVPCKVNYEKQGSTETLWHYRNESGQCEQQAREFLDKQRSWGWQCQASGNIGDN